MYFFRINNSNANIDSKLISLYHAPALLRTYYWSDFSAPLGKKVVGSNIDESVAGIIYGGTKVREVYTLTQIGFPSLEAGFELKNEFLNGWQAVHVFLCTLPTLSQKMYTIFMYMESSTSTQFSSSQFIFKGWRLPIFRIVGVEK